MKNLMKILFWGFLLWLGIFAVSFAIYPFKTEGSPLFETLIAISLTAGSVLFSIILFKNIDENYFETGVKVGITWLIINILLDLPLFSFGSMAMPLRLYFEDIGLTYLIIPIITASMGWILEQKIPKSADDHIHLKNAENEEVP